MGSRLFRAILHRGLPQPLSGYFCAWIILDNCNPCLLPSAKKTGKAISILPKTPLWRNGANWVLAGIPSPFAAPNPAAAIICPSKSNALRTTMSFTSCAMVFRSCCFPTTTRHHDKTEGIITYVGGNRLRLQLRTDELPEWADNGKLGIDLLFDDNSYDEMKSALAEAREKNGQTRRAPHPRTHRQPAARFWRNANHFYSLAQRFAKCSGDKNCCGRRCCHCARSAGHRQNHHFGRRNQTADTNTVSSKYW